MEEKWTGPKLVLKLGKYKLIWTTRIKAYYLFVKYSSRSSVWSTPLLLS